MSNNTKQIINKFKGEMDKLFKDAIKKTTRAYEDYEKTTNKIMERWK